MDKQANFLHLKNLLRLWRQPEKRHSKTNISNIQKHMVSPKGNAVSEVEVCQRRASLLMHWHWDTIPWKIFTFKVIYSIKYSWGANLIQCIYIVRKSKLYLEVVSLVISAKISAKQTIQSCITQNISDKKFICALSNYFNKKMHLNAIFIITWTITNSILMKKRSWKITSATGRSKNAAKWKWYLIFQETKRKLSGV